MPTRSALAYARPLPVADASTHAVPEQGLDAAVVALSQLNWALEQSGIPLVQAVRLAHRGTEALRDLTLELQLGPSLGEPQRFRLPDLEPAARVEVGPFDYRLPPGQLREVHELERAELAWSIHSTGRVLAEGKAPVTIEPHHHWPGLGVPAGVLATFVTPGHPVIASVLKRVRDRLGELTGDPALDGYQRRSADRVRAMVQALFETLQRLGITYAEVPAGFARVGQRIRLPEKLLEDQMGCCLDVTVLAAACLEQMGLRPLLVLVEGHAFPATWLAEEQFPEGVVEDLARVRNQIALGRLLAWDSSTTVQVPRRGLEEAIKVAARMLADDARFHLVIDVVAVRKEGFLPLPLRVRPSEPPPPVGESVARTILAEAAAAPAPPQVPLALDADLATASVPHGSRPLEPAPVAARFRRWQERLLDLSLRNRLLNAKLDSAAAIRLLVPDLPLLEDLVASGRELVVQGVALLGQNDLRAHVLLERGLGEELDRRIAADLRAGTMTAFSSPDALAARFKRLERDARLALEEGGANTLYLAIGLLRWREPDDDVEHLAPLILYPIELTLDRVRGRVRLRRRAEDPIANVTLIEKVRRDFGLDLSKLGDTELDASGLDVKRALGDVRAAIQAQPGWEVLETAVVGLFTFGKFLMWRDLEENAESFLESAVVRHIATTNSSFKAAGRAVAPGELDRDFTPSDLPCVVDADATQQAAVAAALSGRSFVLQGPPGTGKSQTITNLIAAALARGKTVLFVAEKMAALEVVHRRLSQVGLGDFCLELHSHKTNKKDVLASLRAPFERAARGVTHGRTAHGDPLATARASLNAYVTAVHATRAIGKTYHQAQGRLLELRHAATIDPLPIAARWTAEQLTHARGAVAELAVCAARVEPVAWHPWHGVTPPTWSAAVEDDLADALGEVDAALAVVTRESEAVRAGLTVDGPLTTSALPALAALARLMASSAVPEVLLGPDGERLDARITSLLHASREQVARRSALATRWTGELLAADLAAVRVRYERWAGALAFVAWFALYSARTVLRRLARSTLPGRGQTLADLRSVDVALGVEQQLIVEAGELERLLSGAWHPSEGCEVLGQLALRARELRLAASVLPGCRLDRAVGDRVELGRSAAALGDALTRLTAGERDVVRLAGVPHPAWPSPTAANHRGVVGQKILALRAALPRFREWARFKAAERVVGEIGLVALTRAHADGRIAAASMAVAFERAVWQAFVRAVRDSEPALASFDGAAHSRLVASFAAGDRAQVQAGAEFVLGELEQRLPEVSSAAESSEPGLLARELRKKARHLPVRRLLAAIPNLLPRLKPCLLMSPMSIAQYLPASARFDLVVFDEASQIGTHDAIGAIARGRQAVIVGDSKQLPPTTFFQRSSDDEQPVDENDQVELESVLDEVVAKGFPEQMLGWHYRSRHDSLIAFSNRHYYGGKLHVFPAAERLAADLGVAWHRVPEGVYQGSSATDRPRTNPCEAAALVEYLVGALRRWPPASRSFGVVTFSVAQQGLIDDLLEEARARHPELEPHFTGDEPLFVKNLETVQGDERDEILFSVAYAAEASGRLRMHFGPLSNGGGERRLNVAITRARKQLRVFSSLVHDQIDLRRTQSEGARHLRAFLEFAAQQQSDTQEVAAGIARSTSGVEADVAAAVRGLGHLVHEGVGCGAYRIDLAVVDPRDPGRYLVGIECDGAHYASASTARDRDRLRAQVLSGLGWRLHRVWTPDWVRDRDCEVARISDVIATALSERVQPSSSMPTSAASDPTSPASPPTNPASPPTNPTRPVSAPSDRLLRAALGGGPIGASRAAADSPLVSAPGRSRQLPYACATLPRVSEDATELHDADRQAQLSELVLAVVLAESPVHLDLLTRRVVGAFGMAKLTAKARQRVDEVVQREESRGGLVRVSEFLWAPKHDRACRSFRELGDRDLLEVAPEELAAAAAWLLERNLSLDRDDLQREVAALFGIARLGRNVVATIEAGLETLLASGRATVDGHRVVWVGSR